jgi:hypothetical protein
MAAGENAPHRWRVGFTDPKGESSVPLTQRVPTVNRLLEALPSSDLRRLLAECETVELAFADVLYTSGERPSHVYFPTSSFVSLIMPIDDSSSLEVGLVERRHVRDSARARC